LPKPAPDSHDFSTLEPDILDESITAADLMFMLEHLHFGRNARSTRQSALLLPAVQWLTAPGKRATSALASDLALSKVSISGVAEPPEPATLRRWPCYGKVDTSRQFCISERC
jgi:hypothetical protein